MGISLTGFSMPIFWWGLLLIILFSGILQLDAGVGADLAASTSSSRVTGFMLIDSLLADEKGAFRSALSPPDPAGDRAGHHPAGGDRAPDALGHARGAGRGLCPHRAGQGPAAAARVIGLHALRNALIPVVTVIGLQVGTLFGGAILTETIFSWPGIGKWMVDSISRRDYPSVQGGLLLIASIVMMVNLGVDLLYGLINPRIRHGADRWPTAPAAVREPLAGRRAACAAGRVLALFQREPRRGRRPRRDRAAWSLAALLAGVIAPHDPTEQYRDAFLLPPAWDAGGSWSSCSAPTRSAATSSRA